MTNRILDCLDGRSSNSELTSHELRLLKKIEAGLRTRSRDYLGTEGLDLLRSPRVGRPRREPSIPPDTSALSAFLERSIRRRLKAG